MRILSPDVRRVQDEAAATRASKAATTAAPATDLAKVSNVAATIQQVLCLSSIFNKHF